MRALTILFAVTSLGLGQDDGQIRKWIEDLGAEEIEVRDKAEGALIAAGEKALPQLKAAAESDNAEVKARAKRAIEKITWILERQPITLDLVKGVKMEFVRIPAGKFVMGDKDVEDAPPHEVTLTKDFWIQTTETTQAQWEAVMGKNPSQFQGADRPVEMVSWEDGQEFMKKLNEKMKDQLKGKKAGLPTEAQWEYACRAGEKGKWCFGDDEEKLEDYAWIEQVETCPVGRKKANRWGLFDMHGNVREWCQDWYGVYEKSAATDPVGPAKGDVRCLRSGHSDTAFSADRYQRNPVDRDFGVGLRVALR